MIMPTYLSSLTSSMIARNDLDPMKKADDPVERELQDFLPRVLTDGTKARPVFIFVDALDGAGKDAARNLLAYLRDMMKDIEREEGLVKKCVSSRHYPNLGWQVS